MVRTYISNISKSAREAIIPPAGVSILSFLYYHYMHTLGIESGPIFFTNNTFGVLFFMLFTIVYTQTRFEEQSTYTLQIKNDKIILYESYNEEYPILVGEINYNEIRSINAPNNYHYSWFFCWIFYTLKFIKLSHLVNYRQLSLEVGHQFLWPKDLSYKNTIIIPFYFLGLKEIYFDIKKASSTR